MSGGGGLRHALLDSAGVPHGFGVRDSVPPPTVVRPRQVHGIAVASVVDLEVRPAEADAIVSESSSYPVGIVTADCVPVLACSEDGAVVAAIHAGWRGLAAGVVEAAIEELRGRSGARVGLRAVVGPHIGPCCYEVDRPVLDPLRARFGSLLDSAVRRSAPDRPGHWLLDLGRLVAAALERVGVSAAQRGFVPASCTYCNPKRFHSYRRDGKAAGRLVHHVGPARPKRGS
jgi:YfiH family protein